MDDGHHSRSECLRDTPTQLLAFLLAVVASYLSARWATAETRKQFSRKVEDDERAAAAGLIPLLIKLALEYEKKKNNLSVWIATEGRDGEDRGIAGVSFDPKIQSAAARLGSAVTARAIMVIKF
jgi:hypothetical protein